MKVYTVHVQQYMLYALSVRDDHIRIKYGIFIIRNFILNEKHFDQGFLIP